LKRGRVEKEEELKRGRVKKSFFRLLKEMID
jgi:hypothetical protein